MPALSSRVKFVAEFDTANGVPTGDAPIFESIEPCYGTANDYNLFDLVYLENSGIAFTGLVTGKHWVGDICYMVLQDFLMRDSLPDPNKIANHLQELDVLCGLRMVLP